MLSPDQRRAKQIADLIAQQISALRGEIATLNQLLSQTIQQQEDARRANQAASEEREAPDPQAPLAVITQRSERETETHETDREQDSRFQSRSLIVQWALFGATLLAFGAAAYYAHIARQQLIVSQDQIRVSQRPWVGLIDHKNALQVGPLRFDEKSNASILSLPTMRNYGATAAQNVKVSVRLVITDDEKEIAPSLSLACAATWEGPPLDGGILLFPGTERGADAAVSGCQRRYMTSHYYGGQFGAWLAGCIQYRDQFSHSYYTKFVYVMTRQNELQRAIFYATPNSVVEGHFIPYQSEIQ